MLFLKPRLICPDLLDLGLPLLVDAGYLIGLLLLYSFSFCLQLFLDSGNCVGFLLLDLLKRRRPLLVDTLLLSPEVVLGLELLDAVVVSDVRPGVTVRRL